MPTPHGDIDPSLFTKDRQLEFADALSSAANQFVGAQETIATYLRENSPEIKAAAIKDVEDNADYQGLVELVGKSYIDGVLLDGVLDIPRTVEEREYEIAQQQREESSQNIVGYVVGYQNHAETELRAAFGEDDEEVLAHSWTATWNKLKGILLPRGGTTLAEIADLFDDLVRLAFTNVYDPVDRLRGQFVSQDVAARSFYEVMEPHLARAIQRSGDDNWTGH